MNPRGWVADLLAARGFREAWMDRKRAEARERKDQDGHEGYWHELLDEVEGMMAEERYLARTERRTA